MIFKSISTMQIYITVVVIKIVITKYDPSQRWYDVMKVKGKT